MNQIKVISEIGSNHNGDIELAKKMIDASIECGVDAVKFQTFQAHNLVSTYAPMANYQVSNLGVNDSQVKMLEKLQLSKDDFAELFEYAKNKEIEIFSTPFDIESVDLLNSFGMKIWKIPSGEITNLPYLEYIRDLNIDNKHIVLSTGMADIEEIKVAYDILKENCDKVTILHCNTNYPSRDEDLNLNAIDQLKSLFPNADIGYSDHSTGITAAVVACGFGISMIEKHFTLSNHLPGPDHPMSMTPEQMKDLCDNVRRAEKMLGKNEKIVTDSEAPNRVWARKSIVANKDINAGEVLTEENITTKRPGTGISPMEWHNILGKKVKKSYKYDELLKIEDIE